jgi:hypothetical protein
MIKTKECAVKIAIPFVTLGLLVAPTFMGASVIGENSSARAEEIRIGVPSIRVEDRDYDRDRDHRWRRDHDRDDVVVIKKKHRDHDRDDD